MRGYCDGKRGLILESEWDKKHFQAQKLAYDRKYLAVLEETNLNTGSENRSLLNVSRASSMSRVGGYDEKKQTILTRFKSSLVSKESWYNGNGNHSY